MPIEAANQDRAAPTRATYQVASRIRESPNQKVTQTAVVQISGKQWIAAFREFSRFSCRQ